MCFRLWPNGDAARGMRNTGAWEQTTIAVHFEQVVVLDKQRMLHRGYLQPPPGICCEESWGYLKPPPGIGLVRHVLRSHTLAHVYNNMLRRHGKGEW